MVARLRALGQQHGYTFSMVKTNTELHGLPQQRMRTFYFFWRSTTVPFLNYYSGQAPHLHQYLKTIPRWASLQQETAVTTPTHSPVAQFHSANLRLAFFLFLVSHYFDPPLFALDLNLKEQFQSICLKTKTSSSKDKKEKQT